MNPFVFYQVEQNPLYVALLVFFGLYPVLSSIVWITTSILYYVRREWMPPRGFYDLPETPLVTVLVPAYCEGKVIRRTLEGILAIDYPAFEVLVVDDGSDDETMSEVLPLVRAGMVRLVHKTVNEGKAMALNDAIPCCRGELILIMDADAYPDPMILRTMVPHFRSARVGAVTGNPKVANRETFLSKLQVIEFTSIVSVLRRAQRVWGRILTMSGVVGMFRKSALIDAGLYCPEMATEDIDISWKLQMRFYDIRYESRAVVWMQVPPSFARLWKQRMRWAKGLAQILRRHRVVVARARYRRLWPVYAEASLSVAWAYTAIILFSFWTVSYLFGYLPFGISPIPGWWGMLIASMCLLQLLTGVMLEREYDKDLFLYFGAAVYYPIAYWMLMALVTSLSTPAGLFGPLHRGSVTRWRTVRDLPGRSGA